MSSRGGLRQNAGRKRKKESELKRPKQIYFSSELIEKISSLELGDCKTFSTKVSFLVEEGIKKILTDRGINEFMVKSTVRVADLFAGMGGIRLGMHDALKKRGIQDDTVFISEIKKSAIEVYKDNFGNPDIVGDITKISEKDIPDIDYLLAGFPCQAFSYAGKRRGFEDTRGTLFFDVARILKEKQPRGFILENVEGLTTHDKGRTFETIINTLENIGYTVSYKVLDSKDFGLAQSRKRIYIVGTNNGKKVNLNFESNKPCLLEDIIDFNVPAEKSDFSEKLLSHFSLDEIEGKQIKDKRGGKSNIHSWDFALKGEVSNEQKELLNLLLKQRRNKKWASVIGIDWMDGMPLTAEMIRTFYNAENLVEMLDDLVDKGYLVFEYPKKKTSKGREYDTEKPKGYNIVTGKLSFKYSKILAHKEVTPTLVATDLSHLAVPVKDGIRNITNREGLRLFGYPETYSLEKVTQPKAYDLLGNTVAVSVISAVADRLLNATESK